MIRLAVAAVLALAAAGCEECQQGESRSCSCGASTGSQLCLPGHSFGGCTCGDDLSIVHDMTLPPDLYGVDLAAAPADLSIVDTAAPPPDLASSATMVAGGTVTLYGVTSDDYIIYGSSAGLYALPFAGGQAIQLEPANTAIHGVVISQQAALIFTGAGTSLAVWSKASGVHGAPSPVVAEAGAADPAGTRVWYRSTAAKDDVVGAPINLSGETVLYPAADVVALGFYGARLVVSHVADGTSTPATVTTFDANWKPTDLEAMADPAATFAATDKTVAVLTVAGALETVPIGGGAAKQVDPSAVADGPVPGQLYADSSAIVYLQNTGVFHLERAALPNVARVELAQGARLASLSPDDQTVAFATVIGQSGASSDLKTSPAGAPGQLATIDSGSDNRLTGFTADGAHILYLSGYQAGTSRGTLSAQPIGGGAARTLGLVVGARVFPVAGPGVLLGANDTGAAADVVYADAATGATTTLVAQAAALFPSSAGDRVVYATPPNGLWIATLP